MNIIKSLGVFFCFSLTSCYFGANESGEEIINDFYLARWDQNTWISYSKDSDSIFEPKKIVIGHNVFAVGNNNDFIVAKQHPCENMKSHFMDYDSLKPNRTITNYIIIDTRNHGYKLHSYSSEKEFNNQRIQFGIPKSLPYQFYDKELE